MGLEPPETVARSDADRPTMIELGVTVEDMVGVPFETGETVRLTVVVAADAVAPEGMQVTLKL